MGYGFDLAGMTRAVRAGLRRNEWAKRSRNDVRFRRLTLRSAMGTSPSDVPTFHIEPLTLVGCTCLP
jgi:hypothetical protein